MNEPVLKHIAFIDTEDENLNFVQSAASFASNKNPENSYVVFHLKSELNLYKHNVEVVFISTNWILEFGTEWFFQFYNNNCCTKFVILINHSQATQMRKLLTILHSLPSKSFIGFIPMDNYSDSIVIQCMTNHIIDPN
jgi:hypothetical protein